jgi:hypothetical protein
MDALFWMAMLAGCALIIRIRYAPEHDQVCEFCHRWLDSSDNRHTEMDYVAEMGDIRAFSTWFFCSENCALMFLDEISDAHE